jgi:signal transduction histidine kinase
MRNDPLDAVWRESAMALDFARTAKFRDVVDLIVSQQRFIASMQGRDATFSTFSDERFDEAAFEAELTAARMPTIICLHWIRKLKARYLSGDYAEALLASGKVKALLWISSVQLQMLDYSYYTALTVRLARDHPDLEEARKAAMRVVKDATRASEIISRIRLLFNKGTPERELVDVNEIIGEMIVLLRSEAIRYNISVRTELAADLSQITGDRVQLQQVLMNLMINGIDAMKDADGARELAIKSQRAEGEQLLVSVSDIGVGLPPQQADQIFNAFVTTKPRGTGMGLSISRSIVESHGGRLWAAANSPRGASFYFTLSANPRVPQQ